MEAIHEHDSNRKFAKRTVDSPDGPTRRKSTRTLFSLATVSWNEAAVRIFGWSRHEAIGTNLHKVLTNLIGNAVKFTSRGEVAIRGNCQGYLLKPIDQPALLEKLKSLDLISSSQPPESEDSRSALPQVSAVAAGAGSDADNKRIH